MTSFRSAAVAAIALVAASGLNIARADEERADQHAPPMAAPAGQPAPVAMQQDDEDQDETDDEKGMGPMGPGKGGGATMPMTRMMQGMSEMMQGMMQMMESMGQRPPAPAMMPGPLTAERLDAVKTELGITAAQEPQWNAFVDAMRAHRKAMLEMRAQMMQQGPAANWPDRIAQHERMLTAHLEAMKAIEAPARALWDVLSDDQRRKANALLGGHMGMKGMKGRM